MITFLGDVSLLKDDIKCTYNPENPYIFNLEYVIGKKNNFKPTPGKINLISENSDFISLFGKNPVAVSIANNHIFDYGKSGYENTLKHIHEKDIFTVGDGMYIFENICFLAYEAFNQKDELNKLVSFDYKKALSDINNAKCKKGISIIVYMHWGIENHPHCSSEQIKIAHWLINNGVDLIIGTHSHCIQPVELYNGKYIFYGLGNCAFPSFSLNSHFDNNGISKRKYRFKWQRWNRKSYSVIYDEKKQSVSHVDILYQRKNVVKKVKSLKVERLVKNNSFTFINNIIYNFRKYWLFFASNSFVEGKLFDISAISAERHKTK